MSPEKPLKIVVVGAGIGGLAAARVLHQRAIHVEVCESASALAEVGAGLQLGPKPVKVLDALGLKDEVDAAAFEPLNGLTLNWDDATCVLVAADDTQAVATFRDGAEAAGDIDLGADGIRSRHSDFAVWCMGASFYQLHCVALSHSRWARA